MNDIDDDRDELAFAQLDLARYQAYRAPGVAHVRRQFEMVRQDQHSLRRVGALFGVPDIARDGDQTIQPGMSGSRDEIIYQCAQCGAETSKFAE